MPCEPLVNERVVRIQKVRYAPVLTDRAPQEKRQSRRNLEIAEAIDRFPLLRVSMDAEQKIGIDQQALERELNTGVKRSAVTPSLVEELQQRLHILLCDGPAVGQARYT